MALFGAKKTKKAETPKEAGVSVATHLGSQVIVRPRITEKSHTMAEGHNVFVFDVASGATKGKVADAIQELYKVTPIKVSVVPVPRKQRMIRGRIGYTNAGRKAYVYLKKGDKIEIV
ncbi:MAG: 50S ribosomal protein L23 [Candidatus Taylorbacteria bacterium]|nr:50S ribosomal protein L23 [Candidatus Taylorbacteria bacterium]